MSLRSWVLLLGAVGLLGALTGCKQSAVCDGILLDDGECRPADVSADPATCGTGTIFENGRCVAAAPPMLCDPQYNDEVWDGDAGVIICRSNCVIDDFGCDGAFACPSAAVGKVTLCGRLIDAFTGERVAYDGQSSGGCDPLTFASSGPCSLQFSLYDADELAASPGSAAPLAAEELFVDECGRFRAVNLERPSGGRVAVIAEDVGADPTYVTSGLVLSVASGEVRDNLGLHVVSSNADLAWSTSAGIGPPNFSVRGALLSIYRAGSQAVAGVRVTREGSASPDDDYYFSDQSTTYRTTIDPALTVTGNNGSALSVNMALGSFAGEGPTGSGCSWSAGPGASIPGIFLVQTHVNDSTGACP